MRLRFLNRRVSIPLGENNGNTIQPPNNEAPSSAGGSVTPRAHSVFPITEPGIPYTTTMNSLGKRRQPDEQGDLVEASDRRENDRRPKKYARSAAGRRPLQEKPMGPGREHEHIQGHESGEESVASAGTSTGPSTAPSVGTPPPVIHEPQCFDAPQDGQSENGIFNFSFRQAPSSTPRHDAFNFFEAEPFSPGSAMKDLVQVQRNDAGMGANLQAPFEMRRISANVARPQTPKRSTGHERFRITTEQVNATPVPDDAPPYDPYVDDVFNLQNVNGQFVNNNAPAQAHGYPTGPMSLSQIGLDTTVTTASTEAQTPVHRTMYGTEVQNDKRFGDFGRDELGTSSNINFWAPFRL